MWWVLGWVDVWVGACVGWCRVCAGPTAHHAQGQTTATHGTHEHIIISARQFQGSLGSLLRTLQFLALALCGALFESNTFTCKAHERFVTMVDCPRSAP